MFEGRYRGVDHYLMVPRVSERSGRAHEEETEAFPLVITSAAIVMAHIQRTRIGERTSHKVSACGQT